jgi:5-methyltetrahydropteroyltriglutamate--homocysteine methyltransferase
VFTLHRSRCSCSTDPGVHVRPARAAEYIAPARLGTTDDCGFAPFADDTSTSRDIAFEKIRARVVGTQLAATQLGI